MNKKNKKKYLYCLDCGKKFLTPHLTGYCNICKLKQKQKLRKVRSSLDDFS